MRRIKITFDYIGTAYDGWQRQPGRDTVQQSRTLYFRCRASAFPSLRAAERTQEFMPSVRSRTST